MSDYDTEDEEIVLAETDTKDNANKLLSDGKYNEAITIYTRLLKNDSNNYIILSNRSVAYFKLEEYKKAMDDCIKTTRLSPDWAKGWGRLGATLYKLKKSEKATVAYEKAYNLEKDANKQSIYKNMLNHINKCDDNMDNMLESMFDSIISNPSIMDKIINPEFQNKVLSMQSNPFLALQDEEIMDVMKKMIKKLD
jgi:tetratricopeptide (TPR) repeat protein